VYKKSQNEVQRGVAMQSSQAKFLNLRVSGLTFRIRTAFFWVVMQRVLVIPYRRFGTTYQSHLQGILDP
jgi:hypothetical protein